MQNNTNLIKHEQALDFITAGNAIITLKSNKTENRFTYKIKKYNDNTFYVKILTGNDNNSDYSSLLKIECNDCAFELKYDKQSRVDKNAKSIQAFIYTFYKIVIKQKAEGVEIWHEGRCCRCGRRLTVPESIESGIGPECATKF